MLKILKKEQEKKQGRVYEVMVSCGQCNDDYLTFVAKEGLKCCSTGKKNRICVYTECPICGYKIVIPTSGLRKKVVRDLKRSLKKKAN